jgi:hypothetical protein
VTRHPIPATPPVVTPPLLTVEELAVVDALADATNLFVRLSVHRPGECNEWVNHVHPLQDMVMSRAAVRAYPDLFTPLRTIDDKQPDPTAVTL